MYFNQIFIIIQISEPWKNGLYSIVVRGLRWNSETRCLFRLCYGFLLSLRDRQLAELIIYKYISMKVL